MVNKEIAILDESTIRDMVYEIGGKKVMLDFDLARIYGYTTKSFNRQVKNNSERFVDGFLFQLTRDELEDLVRCKNFTSRENSLFSGQNGGSRYLPHAFTEEGIYMLMTVLKGELAVRQSIVLIKLFKAMKDQIEWGSPLSVISGLSKRIEQDEQRIGNLESKIDVVMAQFEDPSAKKEFLIMDGERIEASIAYQSIYAKARSSVILIDDYVGLKTLRLLKSCQKGVSIVLLSDNVGRVPLTQGDLSDFSLDTGLSIELRPTNGRVHDRYVVLDHGQPEEEIYHCGSSSKDAGNKITTIMKVESPKDYASFIDALL